MAVSDTARANHDQLYPGDDPILAGSDPELIETFDASRGGRTALSNPVTLCSGHHRLVHDGGYRLELSRAGRLSVTSPEGLEVRAVPDLAHRSREELHRANVARGMRPDPEALRGDGERCDLGCAIDGLLSLGLRTAARPAGTAGTAAGPMAEAAAV